MASSFSETSTDASRVLFIDSRDGKNIDDNPQITTNYSILLEDPILVPPHHAILLSLHRLNVPRTFYNFQKNRNNGVEIRFESADGGTGAGFGARYTTGGGLPKLTFEINEGNYNAISIMNKLLLIVGNYLRDGVSRFANRNLHSGGHPAPNDINDRGIYQFKMIYNADTMKYEWLIQPILEVDKRNTARDIRMSFLWKTGSSYGSDLTSLNKDTSIRQEIGFITNRWVNGTTFDFYTEFVGNTGATDLAPQSWIWKSGFGSASTDGSTWGNNSPIDTKVGGRIRNITGLSTKNIQDNLNYFRGYDDGVVDQDTGDNNYFSCVDMNYHTSNLYIHTSITQHSIIDSRIGCRYSNILACIPVNVDSGSEVVVSPSDGAEHKVMLKVREITDITVTLTDLNDKVIDLNGLDWTISLKCDFIEMPTVTVQMDKRQEIEEIQYKKFMEEYDASAKGKIEELKSLRKIERSSKFSNV
tara:strand:- start:1366 stop:2781 length:1416 start_codon:yes stop_codon:yes gene_type:complete